MSQHRITRAPATFPLSLAEAKRQLELPTGTTHDATLRRFIRSATSKAVDFCRRDFHLTQRTLTLDRWHDLEDREGFGNMLAFSAESLRINHIEIPHPPLVAVDSVTYADHDGDEQTLAASLYTVDTDRQPGRILPVYNETWPSARYDAGSIQIAHWSGYVQAVTADATGDTLTLTNQRYSDGDIVTVDNYGGALPGGIDRRSTYYVVTATDTTIQLSATEGGAAIDLTSAGTGTHVINEPPEQVKQAIAVTITHWFEERSGGTETPDVRLRGSLPPAAADLLAGIRMKTHFGHYALQR